MTGEYLIYYQTAAAMWLSEWLNFLTKPEEEKPKRKHGEKMAEWSTQGRRATLEKLHASSSQPPGYLLLHCLPTGLKAGVERAWKD